MRKPAANTARARENAGANLAQDVGPSTLDFSHRNKLMSRNSVLDLLRIGLLLRKAGPLGRQVEDAILTAPTGGDAPKMFGVEPDAFDQPVFASPGLDHQATFGKISDGSVRHSEGRSQVFA